jgi:hypothetical protein
MPYDTPTAGGEIDYRTSPAGIWKRGVIRERVAGQGASGYLTLSQQLPKNSKIVWAVVNNRNAITPRAASSAAASNVAIMGVALVYTAPSSLATNAATSNVLLACVQSAFGASVSANNMARGIAQAVTTAGGITPTAYLYGAGTAPVSMHLVPYASTVATDANGVGRFYVVSATGTSQYTLNGTSTATTGTASSTFDVEVHFEEFVLPDEA